MTDLNHLEQSGVSSVPSNEFFNHQWQLYQKILNNNYMGHREIYRILHEFLARYSPKPFKMIDLGCGDASFVAQALMNTTITFYQGIDQERRDVRRQKAEGKKGISMPSAKTGTSP